jgi:hypothetical protein
VKAGHSDEVLDAVWDTSGGCYASCGADGTARWVGEADGVCVGGSRSQ